MNALAVLALVPAASGFQSFRVHAPPLRLRSSPLGAGSRSADEIMAGPRTGDQISPACGQPLEVIAANWVACAKLGIPLVTQNNTFFKEETYQVAVQRAGGLGLVLSEVWADEDAGSDRGVVLVEEVVENSNAAKAGGIAVGDTIVGVFGASGLAEGSTTEGLNWDSTVDALGAVDGPEITLTMKRLVKRGRINVRVTASTGENLGTFNCPSGANLRMEFLRRQLPKDEIYDPNTMRFDAIGNYGSNCGGEGSCGTCLVAITEDEKGLVAPSKGTEKKALAKQGRPVRWRWSCRTTVGDGGSVDGDISIQLQPQVRFPDEQKKTEGLGV
eukprot:CAMPEP_0172591118 /NCGR_PEP_ID=MMETSP1068-20121228/9767_1 /TAXON_ID=35684 /ORGANISM="Pseudopedinella elastica, Strain CCMP716" /LENGTH=328 /DNA_ID=CAMNT_0013387341 /DNA_START=66 /DNA_END=1052 /DNA_ORIENTATION=-